MLFQLPTTIFLGFISNPYVHVTGSQVPHDWATNDSGTLQSNLRYLLRMKNSKTRDNWLVGGLIKMLVFAYLFIQQSCTLAVKLHCACNLIALHSCLLMHDLISIRLTWKSHTTRTQNFCCNWLGWWFDQNACVYVPIHSAIMHVGRSNFWECCTVAASSVLTMIGLDLWSSLQFVFLTSACEWFTE